MRASTQTKVVADIEFEARRDSHPEGFPALPEIPGGRYIDPTFHALENTHVWRKSWLCAGRADEIPAAGDYKLFDRIGVVLVIMRGNDGVIRAFHNTCRHRGAPLVKACSGNAKRLICGYHAWGYDLAGRLVSVPDAHDFCGLDKSARGLLTVRAETWGGWIFINLDSNARPLADELQPISENLQSLSMDRLTIKGRLSYTIKCNWKAAMDAFLEVYHVKVIHPRTVHELLDSRATAITLFAGGHSRMAMRKKKNQDGGTLTSMAGPDIPTTEPIFRANNLAYNAFPNLVTPIDSGGFPFLLFWPTAQNETVLEVIMVGWSEEGDAAYWDALIAGYDAVLQEDLQFLASIQRSLESGAFTGMMLNYQERRIYWLHEEIDRRIGPDRIPAPLRVTPMLGSFVEAQ